MTSSFDDELLHRVGVRPGRVEDDDALLGAALDRDVVDAGPRAGDGQKAVSELKLVEVRGAHHEGVGALRLAHELVAPAEVVGPDLGDVVEAADLVHVTLLS